MTTLKFRDCCQHCGEPLTDGGYAIGCTATSSVRIKLPDWCSSAECARDRDESAIEKAILAGVIDR